MLPNDIWFVLQVKVSIFVVFPEVKKFNAFFYFSFSGQVVSAEILMASELGCPIEMHRIPIEKCDEMYDPECKGDTFMPFHRASYDKDTGQSPNTPREQVRPTFVLIYSNI